MSAVIVVFCKLLLSDNLFALFLISDIGHCLQLTVAAVFICSHILESKVEWSMMLVNRFQMPSFMYAMIPMAEILTTISLQVSLLNIAQLTRPSLLFVTYVFASFVMDWCSVV